MISYREKEMIMVMKFMADHSSDFAEQLMDTHKKMTGSEAVVESINILPEIQNYASLVEYVNSQGYDTILRMEDLLSEEDLAQLEKEYDDNESEFKSQTGLNKTDALCILIAVVLQMIRQFLQPSVNFDLFKNKKDRPSHNTTADEAKKSVYDKDKSKYYEE